MAFYFYTQKDHVETLESHEIILKCLKSLSEIFPFALKPKITYLIIHSRFDIW